MIEALARADASIAWCSFIWCDSGIYSGYLDDAVAREMYPRLDMATSGWVYLTQIYFSAVAEMQLLFPMSRRSLDEGGVA